jgi:indole-3-glycerol phosphate synthase
MADVLQRICWRTRAEVAARRAARPLAELERALADAPPLRPFAAALADADAGGRLALIGEIKKASPSRGLIRPDFDPASLARAYAAAGATCLSVLTDRAWFQGADEHLLEARAATGLPVLRKDFTLDPYQVVEGRLLGADCILLIMAALDDRTASELARLAAELGLEVLVEAHDAPELDRALALGTRLVGINNRNLKTLQVDLSTTLELAGRVPADRILVAESGLGRHAELVRARAAGARAFLVGESLLREADVGAATRRLLGLAA